MMSAPPPRPDRSVNPLIDWITRHKVWSVVIGVVILLLVIGALSPSDDAQTAASATTRTPAEPTTTPLATPTQTPSPTPAMVKVPAVVGVKVEGARQKLQVAGLTVTDTRKKYSHQPHGTVLSTSEKPGSRLEKGSSVTLIIAKPFPKVPGVSGLSASVARTRLKRAGYNVVITKQTSSAPAGSVIGTNPGAGSERLPGKTVVLLVAKPAPAPPPSQSNCTPGYSPCLREGPSDYDCSGGSGDGPAYTEPGVTYRVSGYDPYELDSD